MKNIIILLFATFFIISCEKSSREVENKSTEEKISLNEIVKSTSTDSNGVLLDMTFDNGKYSALLFFKGEKIELQGQPVGSGIWYKNDEYELRGKGEDIILTKNGEIVFKSK